MLLCLPESHKIQKSSVLLFYLQYPTTLYNAIFPSPSLSAQDICLFLLGNKIKAMCSEITTSTSFCYTFLNAFFPSTPALMRTRYCPALIPPLDLVLSRLTAISSHAVIFHLHCIINPYLFLGAFPKAFKHITFSHSPSVPWPIFPFSSLCPISLLCFANKFLEACNSLLLMYLSYSFLLPPIMFSNFYCNFPHQND